MPLRNSPISAVLLIPTSAALPYPLEGLDLEGRQAVRDRIFREAGDRGDIELLQ
jgi:hypothetical protein